LLRLPEGRLAKTINGTGMTIETGMTI